MTGEDDTAAYDAARIHLEECLDPLCELCRDIKSCDTCGRAFDLEMGGMYWSEEGVASCEPCWDAETAQFAWMARVPDTRSCSEKGLIRCNCGRCWA
jgi:hypothetical protein